MGIGKSQPLGPPFQWEMRLALDPQVGIFLSPLNPNDVFYFSSIMNLNALEMAFIMEANTMDPDQNVHEGAVLRSSLIWVHSVCNIGHQSTSSDKLANR